MADKQTYNVTFWNRMVFINGNPLPKNLPISQVYGIMDSIGYPERSEIREGLICR